MEHTETVLPFTLQILYFKLHKIINPSAIWQKNSFTFTSFIFHPNKSWRNRHLLIHLQSEKKKTQNKNLEYAEEEILWSS